MTGIQRLPAAFVLLAAVFSAPDRNAVGEPGELEVTLRVLDDATGVVAPRITIPPEPSRSESPERAAAPSPPAEEAAATSDVRPPASAAQ